MSLASLSSRVSVTAPLGLPELAADPLNVGIVWDAESRLTEVKQGATTLAAFVYDGRGRRVQKTAGGVTRTYVWQATSLVEERWSTGQTVRNVEGADIDQHLARQEGSTVNYYVADHLASVVQETDSAGTVTIGRKYDPWGNLVVGASAAGWAYTGREWDSEIGLYYYRARYYDPKAGRFTAQDPRGFEIGPNLYAYVGGRPTVFRDPSGLLPYTYPPPIPTTPPLPPKYPKPDKACCDPKKIEEAKASAQAQKNDMDAGRTPSGTVTASVTRSHSCDKNGDCVPIVEDPEMFDPGIVKKEDPCVDYCTTVHEWVHWNDNRKWSTKWGTVELTNHTEYPGYVKELECLNSF